MASLGVLLVVIGALAGWRYVASNSTATNAYVAVYQSVPVGRQIKAEDLQLVNISSARGLTPIPASEESSVIGQYAKVELVPGTLLTDADLMATNAIGSDQVLIGLELTAAERPGRKLKPGDKVLLIEVPPTNGLGPSDTTGTTMTMATMPATVVEAGEPDNTNNAVVDVVIPVADASVVAWFANQGRVAVVLSGS